MKQPNESSSRASEAESAAEPNGNGSPECGGASSRHSVAVDNDDDSASLRSVILAVVCVGLVEVVLSAVYWDFRVAVSVGYGACLGLGNLMLLGRMVRAFLAKGGVSAPWLVAALVKLVVLGLALYLPVRARYIELMPFVLGFGALPVGIVLGQFLFLPPQRKAS